MPTSAITTHGLRCGRPVEATPAACCAMPLRLPRPTGDVTCRLTNRPLTAARPRRAQFLESYKSVTVRSMAESFGVSVAFMDHELSNFIVSGRLNAKIDSVGGVVETNRPDAKNALYQQAIKHGDLLLNNIQKLSKVIDME